MNRGKRHGEIEREREGGNSTHINKDELDIVKSVPSQMLAFIKALTPIALTYSTINFLVK